MGHLAAHDVALASSYPRPACRLPESLRMKPIYAVLALVCSLGAAVPVQATSQHAHEHAGHEAAVAASVPARRWVPDAALRQGIRRAHAAVDQLRHHEMGHMSAPMAVDRAVQVEQAVTFMFAHCKLSAEPDAALHGILVPLLGAAQSLKADAANVAAVAAMREALARYPQYFDDPGWDAPVMPQEHDQP
jgi:uncharacterized protein involved in copper resistance